MLSSIRKFSTSFLGKIVIGLIAVAFIVGFGMSGSIGGKQNIVAEVNGEKIYYDIESGELLHEQGSVIFLELSNIFSIGFVGIVIAIMFSSELINEEYTIKIK